MIRIGLLGSTGSIGVQTLNVVRRHSDKFKITALAAGSNSELFLKQVKEFSPAFAGLSDSASADKIKEYIPKTTEFYGGNGALELAAAYNDTDIIVAAVSGFCVIGAVIKAIESGKDVAIASKEVLVSGGALVTALAREKGVKLIPVDSEHSAIFQALDFNCEKKFKRLILTASGGAFRDLDVSQLKYVTAADALKHPNWSMGKKITIDSATLMNKGLEVIEAMWLFSCGLDRVDAVLHKESIIHSMVEFEDNTVLAQMSYPSMEIPIQIALSYPNRLSSDIEPLDFFKLKSLNFDRIDHTKYPCYKTAIESAKAGGNMPCAMNAANEAAVGMFLDGRIGYLDIHRVIDGVLNKTAYTEVKNITELTETDRRARELAFALSTEII